MRETILGKEFWVKRNRRTLEIRRDKDSSLPDALLNQWGAWLKVFNHDGRRHYQPLAKVGEALGLDREPGLLELCQEADRLGRYGYGILSAGIRYRLTKKEERALKASKEIEKFILERFNDLRDYWLDTPVPGYGLTVVAWYDSDTGEWYMDPPGFKDKGPSISRDSCEVYVSFTGFLTALTTAKGLANDLAGTLVSHYM